MKHKYERVGYYKKSTFLPQYVEGGGREKKKVGSRLFQIGYRGEAKLFYKEVQGGQQIDGEVHFNRGPLAK